MPSHEISENSNVKLSVVGGIVLAILSSIAVITGATWWCSAINTKLDTVIDEVKKITIVDNKVSELGNRLVDHEARIKNLEKH